MRILVTGFEPFGGDPENASQEAVRRLPAVVARQGQLDVELVTAVLPVTFADSGAVLVDLVAEHRPAAVLAVGEAGGRSVVTPERWGVNEDDARIPDNAGAQPRGVAIDQSGPERRASGFDVDVLVRAIRHVGVSAEASEDAGRFVCNHVAYLVAGLEVPGAFVHVPAVRSAGRPTVGAETDSRAAQPATTTPLTFNDLATALGAVVRAIADGSARI